MIKWYVFWIVILVAGAYGVLHLPRAVGNDAIASRTVVAPAFDGQRAWSDLRYQVAAGYRIPGTEVHRTMRKWLMQQLAAVGWIVTTQPFTHKVNNNDLPMWNIIATLPGSQTDIPPVVLAAHWDSRPTADRDPVGANRTLPIDGANDGASGVAVLLEIARQLPKHPVAFPVTIVLFDGEDYGPGLEDMLLGSTYYASHLPSPKPAWGVLLDMIGDKDLGIYREPNSELYAHAVNDRLFHAASALGFRGAAGVSGFVDKQYQCAIEDDHMPLNRAGVPMADLIDFDYPAWHTRADTVEQCSPDSLGIVGKTVLYALHQN